MKEVDTMTIPLHQKHELIRILMYLKSNDTDVIVWLKKLVRCLNNYDCAKEIGNIIVRSI